MPLIKNLRKAVIQTKNLIKIANKMMIKKINLQAQYSHKISLSSKCNLDKGEALKWIILWTEKNKKKKMIFGKIKDKIILEIWKIKKMINSISKAALEEISLIVISIKLNQSTTTKNKFKKDPATISINKSKSKKKNSKS